MFGYLHYICACLKKYKVYLVEFHTSIKEKYIVLLYDLIKNIKKV